MPGKALIARKLPVEATTAWNALRDFGGLDLWFPAIEACTVEGSGIGARRELDLVGEGGRMVDYMRSLDEGHRRLSYERVESPFPVDSYLGTVEVFESFDRLGVVVWTVDFESSPADQEPLCSILEDAIGAGVSGLGEFLRKSSD